MERSRKTCHTVKLDCITSEIYSFPIHCCVKQKLLKIIILCVVLKGGKKEKKREAYLISYENVCVGLILV